MNNDRMQAVFQIPVALRWADLDPNQHVRHSVYYDFGATCRIAFFEARGFPMSAFAQFQIGPILFREEAVFRRELRIGDALTISLEITRLRHDFSRFSFRHEIRRTDGTLCATINVDGAWIDLRLRKLTAPPAEVAALFEGAPKAADFEWMV